MKLVKMLRVAKWLTSTFRLAKKIHRVEQHERIHFKPYFCKIKMKDITRQPR
jgi:hypothetical protein